MVVLRAAAVAGKRWCVFRHAYAWPATAFQLRFPFSAEVDYAVFNSKVLVHFSICASHPCAGAMLIFSISFQFYRMIPEGNPSIWLAVVHVCVVKTWSVRSKSFNNRKGATCVLKIWCHMVLVLDEGPLVHRAPRPTLRAKERSLWAMGVA